MSASKDYFKKAGQAAKKQNFDYAIELYLAGLMIDPKATEHRRKMHKVMTLALRRVRRPRVLRTKKGRWMLGAPSLTSRTSPRSTRASPW